MAGGHHDFHLDCRVPFPASPGIPGDLRAQINRAWKLAYNVTPSEKETLASLVYLAEQTERIRPRVSPAKDKSVPKDPQTLALASFCQALLSANRFLYVE